MPNQHHILDSKKQQIEISLGGLFADVDLAIAAAMHCLTGKDAAQCQALIQSDIRLNDNRRLIEQDCLVAIASHSYDLHHGIAGNPQGNLQSAAVTRAYDAKGKTYEDDAAYL